MTLKHVSKRRLAVAASALTIAGMGVACTVGGGSTAVTAARTGRAAAAAQPAAAIDAGAVVDGATDVASATADRVIGRTALRSRQALRRVLAADRITLAAAGTSVSTGQSGTTASSPAAPAEDDADISLRLPRKASVTLPTVSGVQLPRVQGGSVQLGTLPSAQPGWVTTVDLGDPDPQVTLPQVRVGPVAKVTMPGVSLD